MTWHEKTTCSDCQGKLQNIKLIDATDRGMGNGVGHVELSYAAPSSAASSFTGTISSEGNVRGKLCTECGRIFLYSARGGLG